MYYIRLDDASEYMDVKQWDRLENLLDKYRISPLVGIIPANQDKALTSKYKRDEHFWLKAKQWERKGWVIAMHGYNHCCKPSNGGINPVNRKSEFAGRSLLEQKKSIKTAWRIMLKHDLRVNIFFAPSHTFDTNTLRALKEETDISIISDTIAHDIYYANDFYFIPQQSGKFRRLPLKVTTICLHPNNMTDSDFNLMDKFLSANKKNIGNFQELNMKARKLNGYDRLLAFLYFIKKGIFYSGIDNCS